MKCNKCGYEWDQRKEEPKSCPECKSRLGTHKKKKHDSKEINKEDIKIGGN